MRNFAYSYQSSGKSQNWDFDRDPHHYTVTSLWSKSIVAVITEE